MHWIDPDSLPESAGVVDCFLLNPDAESDGLVLTDGTEVHFPPHLGAAVLSAVRPGSSLRIRGVRPRGVAMIAAVALEPKDGVRIVDDGPPEDDSARKAARRNAQASRQSMEMEGILRQTLHGPKGETRGLLLQDGRSVRFPPHAAKAIKPLLAPGARLFLRGEGLATEWGTVVALREIGRSRDDLRPIEAGPPKEKHPKPPKHKRPHD